MGPTCRRPAQEQFLEGEQSVQLYAYRRSQRGRGHEYAVREAFETWARSMHAGARALTRLKLLASLSVAVRAEPRDRPMPVVNDAAKVRREGHRRPPRPPPPPTP